jgi:hypothetical protein
MNTITGRRVEVRRSPIGAWTFTVRQSSSAVIATVGGWMSGFASACGAIAPKSEASRMPSHDSTATGAANRRFPTGAAAYGMPRQASSPRSRTPRTMPPTTRTSTLSSCSRRRPITFARRSSPYLIGVAPHPQGLTH